MTLTDEQLESIRERAEKATAGPWERVHDRPYRRVADLEDVMTPAIVIPDPNGQRKLRVPENGIRAGDWDFIAHAREDVPALLAEVDALREALRALVEKAELAVKEMRGDGKVYQDVYPVLDVQVKAARKALKGSQP